MHDYLGGAHTKLILFKLLFDILPIWLHSLLYSQTVVDIQSIDV